MLNTKKTAMAISAFAAAVHAVWAILVWIGWGQPLLNFVFNIHFVKPYYTVQPFNILTAIILVAVAAIGGYVIGWFFAWVWNKTNKA